MFCFASQTLVKEISNKSKQVETLMRQAHELVEGDSSQAGSARKAQQLISIYHGLARKAKVYLTTPLFFVTTPLFFVSQ